MSTKTGELHPFRGGRYGSVQLRMRNATDLRLKRLQITTVVRLNEVLGICVPREQRNHGRKHALSVEVDNHEVVKPRRDRGRTSPTNQARVVSSSITQGIQWESWPSSAFGRVVRYAGAFGNELELRE